jgi:CubicO group peptidase (beta-lactamase class C family)
MTLSRRPFLLMTSAALLGAAMSAGAQPAEIIGDWFATLDTGAVQLRLRLNIAAGPRVVLYSIDQGNTPIPASDVRIDADRVRITWAVLQASFEGRLQNGELAGEFRQGTAFPLIFRRKEASAAPVAALPLTQQRLSDLRQKSGSPAMIAAARAPGNRSLAFVDGQRSLGNPAPATTTDKWHVGSCTKSMTATLVARLVEAGRVSWTDTIGVVLGATVHGIRAEYRDVSFLHLLSHQSGLPGNIPLTELTRFSRESADAREERKKYTSIALQSAPTGQKEHHFEYSNSGYVAAGTMLEAKCAEPWEMLVRRHLFEPLGMTGAGFGAPGSPGLNDQPSGHNLGATGTLSPFPPGGALTDNPAVIGPAGRVHATATDLLAYLEAHARKSALLSADSWKRLHTPPYGGTYALGWERRGEAIWHNGSNTLWYAEMLADPVRGAVAMAAANDGRLGNAQPAVGAALMEALVAVT